jgi:peptide/nickel transport system permease protein
MKVLALKTLKQTAILALTLLGVTSVTFGLLNLHPARDLDAAVFSKSMPEYLDRSVPLANRYFRWLTGVMTLNWGISSRDGRPVLERLLERFPATIILNLSGIVFAFVIGIPLGILSAWKHGSPVERVMSWISFLLYSTPSYFLALVLILVFSIQLPDWTENLFGTRLELPISGIRDPLIPEHSPLLAYCLDRLRHAVLPVITLTVFAAVHLLRFTKAAILEVKNKEWILAAKARGISPWSIYFKHCLKNALPPILTVAFLMVPALLGASFIVEIVFAWPGIGFLTYRAVWERDFALIMGGVTMTALLTLLATAAADALSRLADPRSG